MRVKSAYILFGADPTCEDQTKFVVVVSGYLVMRSNLVYYRSIEAEDLVKKPSRKSKFERKQHVLNKSSHAC